MRHEAQQRTRAKMLCRTKSSGAWFSPGFNGGSRTCNHSLRQRICTGLTQDDLASQKLTQLKGPLSRSYFASTCFLKNVHLENGWVLVFGFLKLSQTLCPSQCRGHDIRSVEAYPPFLQRSLPDPFYFLQQACRAQPF